MHVDEHFMRLALAQAVCGGDINEVPVGAVVVKDGLVIGAGHNRTIIDTDPSGHAEIVAIRNAAKLVKNHRLDGCSLYVTLEPCPMCLGAIFHSRIERLVYGANDFKIGAAGSVVDLGSISALNHHCTIEGGVLAEECSTVLSSFFTDLRLLKGRRKAFLRQDALRLPESDLPSIIDAASFGVQSRYFTGLKQSQQLRVHYLTTENLQKSAAIVVFLHGSTTWSFIYRRALSLLRHSNMAGIAIDLPGHGWSDKTKAGAFENNSKCQVALLTEIISSLPGQNIHVVALDIACGYALQIAQSNETHIASLSMINPSPMGGFSIFEELHSRIAAPRSRKQLMSLFSEQSNHRKEVVDGLLAPYPDDGHLSAFTYSNAHPHGHETVVADAGSCISVPKCKYAIHSWSQYQKRSQLFIHHYSMNGVSHYLHSADCEFIWESNPDFWTEVFSDFDNNG